MLFIPCGFPFGQSDRSVDTAEIDFIQRQIVPITKYVSISPVSGSTDGENPLSLDKNDLLKFTVGFDRLKLKSNDGPQFLKITTTI
jgi:hypothetical protein